MTRKFNVVGDAPPPPATAIEHLDAAVAKAKAAGATVFLLSYQVTDEPITTIAYPPAEAFATWFSAMAHDTLHGLRDEPPGPTFIIEPVED